MAVVMAGWGIIMLLPADTFSQPAYAGFRAIFGSENGIGAAMLVLGTLRLSALWVNGRLRRITYWARNWSAGIAWLVWIGMLFAHSLSGVVGVWIVFYLAFAITEFINGGRAARDIGASRGLGS